MFAEQLNEVGTLKKSILPTLPDMRAEGVDCVAEFVRVLRLEGDPAPFSWLKTPKEGSTKGRKREREERKKPSTPRNEVASHKRQPLHQALKRI
jgi:hypothetical protein